MSLIFLDNQNYTLTGILQSTDTTLPISLADKANLCMKLGVSDHSYLTLTTNLGTEILRVSCTGGEPFAVRGVDGTIPLTASIGKCLRFVINKPILDEYLPQDYCEPTLITDDSDFLEITPPVDATSCEWKVNLNPDFKAKFAECCPDDDCNNCTLTDGIFNNVTLTVIDGKVCAIEDGTNIVYTGGTRCNCNG